MTDTTYLYHIRRVCDAGNTAEGYIGISNNPARRLTQHQRGGHNIHLDNAMAKYADAEMVILDQGTRAEMLTKEAALRPTDGLGWNIAAGGGMPPSWDQIADPEAKKRATSQALCGREISSETRLKLSEANTGKTHTEDTKRKLSDIGKTKTGRSNNNFKGWWEIDGVRYESLTIAADATGVKWPTVRKRALSRNFLNYRFIPKEVTDEYTK